MITRMAAALGVATALVGTTAAPSIAAELDAAMQTTSYADLLKPVPNATVLLAASDEAARAELLQPAAEGDAKLETVQYYYHHHHRFFRHHHHHHRFFPRFYHHHHHHHHRFYRYGY